MNARARRMTSNLLVGAILLAGVLPVLAAPRKWAIVAAAGSKLQDVTIADLQKLYKGTQKAWPDGKSFTLVVHDPDSAEVKAVLEKIFGSPVADVKAAIAKANEARPMIKVVESDEELMRVVASTPGAIGIMDVYGINSAVKVLRVDGKLPFDAGYAFRGN